MTICCNDSVISYLLLIIGFVILRPSAHRIDYVRTVAGLHVRPDVFMSPFGLPDFPSSTPVLWLTCDHFVGKVSAMGQQLGQFSLPSFQSVHVTTWITGTEKISLPQ